MLGPAFASIVISVVGAFLWPDTFRSTATLRYLSADGPGFSTNLNDRMASIRSRLWLRAIILRYELYPNYLKRLPIEDVVEIMRRNIQLGSVNRRDTDRMKVATFAISFDYQDRFKAQRAVQDLSALLIADNQKTLGAPVGATVSSRAAFEAAAKELESAEARITEFREKNSEHLPDQAAANQETMSSLRSGFTKVQNDIARVTREQATLQAGLEAEMEKRRAAKVTDALPEPENAKLAAYDAQILAAEDQIKTLKVRYTENFPDVKQARQILDKIKADRDALAKEEAARIALAKQKVDAESARAVAAVDGEIKRLQSQMDSKSGEVGKLSKEAAGMDRDVKAMEAKLEGSSDLEKQYFELLKERDLRKSRVDEEEIRYQASLLSAGATKAAAPGDSRVEVVEAANLPVDPIEPSRGLIVGSGSLLGVLAGLIAAGVREANRRSLRNLYGVDDPGIAPPSRRIGWIGWTLAVAAGAGAMAASVFHYYATKV